MRFLKVLVPVLVLASLAACSKPPQAEIDAAQAAVTVAAQNPDVAAYAPDALQAARDRLAQLQAELDAQAAKGTLSRKYDAARNMALEAQAAAESLAVEAATAKEQTKAEAMTLLNDLRIAVPEAEQGLAQARRVPGVRLDFKSLSASLAQAKSEVAAAEGAYTNGDYVTARATADAVKGSLTQGQQVVADAIAAAKASK
jgi:small-conductance mechanosensitive channel